MDIPYTVSGQRQLQQHHLGPVLWLQDQYRAPAPDCLPASCSLPDASSNSYAFSEMPFREAPPDTATTNSFLAMMLTDSNLAGADLILARGVASDSTFPTQTVYLAKTSDPGPQCAVCRVRQRHLRQPRPGRLLPGLDQHRFHVLHQPPRPADRPGGSLPARQRLCPRRHGRQPDLLRAASSSQTAPDRPPCWPFSTRALPAATGPSTSPATTRRSFPTRSITSTRTAASASPKPTIKACRIPTRACWSANRSRRRLPARARRTGVR